MLIIFWTVPNTSPGPTKYNSNVTSCTVQHTVCLVEGYEEEQQVFVYSTVLAAAGNGQLGNWPLSKRVFDAAAVDANN